jgi:hypothetical protein
MPSRKTCSAPEVHLLGEIVVAFGNLELFLETSLWQLLASEDDRERFLMVQALTAGMSFGRKVDAFASMFRQKGIAQAERELAALTKGLSDAEKERNQLIHSAWNYTNIWGGGSFMRMKATANSRRGLRRGFHRMPPGRIEETLRRIEEAAQSLARFTVAYIQASEASES